MGVGKLQPQANFHAPAVGAGFHAHGDDAQGVQRIPQGQAVLVLEVQLRALFAHIGDAESQHRRALDLQVAQGREREVLMRPGRGLVGDFLDGGAGVRPPQAQPAVLVCCPVLSIDASILTGYYICVIQSFKCVDTEHLFNGRRVARFANMSSVAIRKLQLLNAAASLEFLRVPPQNRLEQLKRDRKGQWSIRINDQFRLCFEWRDGHAWRAEIVDYH